MLADLILLAHTAWVLWMLLGLALTLHGLFAKSRFMDRWLFRSLHLGGILLVASFPLLGRLCPLTVWEAQLRGDEDGEGFLAGLLQAFLYWDIPLQIFAYLYVAAAFFTLAAFILRPPEKLRRHG